MGRPMVDSNDIGDATRAAIVSGRVSAIRLGTSSPRMSDAYVREITMTVSEISSA